jgi:CBS domain-containing protein
MKSYSVKDLMIPLAEYAKVSEDATLLDAINALDEAQDNFDKNKYKHRAILVFDKNNHIVGKISQHDVIKALEPNYKKIEKSWHEISERFGISETLIESALKEYSLWDKPLQNLCQKAVSHNVKEVMYTPTEGEYISEDAGLNEAIHRLIMGRHHSLLVTSDSQNNIVGVLRLTDVFEFIAQEVKQCKI